MNWHYQLPANAVPPPVADPDPPLWDPICEECQNANLQNQTAQDSTDVPDSDFGVGYNSGNVAGNTASGQVNLPISGASVPSSLSGIVVQVSVAGQQVTQNFSPAPTRTSATPGMARTATASRCRASSPSP